MDIASHGATPLNGNTLLRIPEVISDRLSGRYLWQNTLRQLGTHVTRETPRVAGATAQYLEALALKGGFLVPEMLQQVQVSLPQIEIAKGESDQTNTLVIDQNLPKIIETLGSDQGSSSSNLTQQLTRLTDLAAKLGIAVSNGERTVEPPSDAAFVRLKNIVDVLEKVGPDLTKWQDERRRNERGLFPKRKRKKLFKPV